MSLSDSSTNNAAVVALVNEIERGVAIVRSLDDEDFAIGRGGQSSVGAHLRHNLDFVNALLNGIAARRVDYNARSRDPRLETDRRHAIKEMEFACERLRSLTPHLLVSLVMVRSEVDEDSWWASSVSREIEFLHSHTVHHYALVSRLIETPDETLGVAKSTLRYRIEQQREYSQTTY
jgi:hypothetical protein